MKIVQIGKYYPPVIGGIEKNVQQAAHAALRVASSHVICMRKGRGPRTNYLDDSVQVTELASYGALWRQEIVESPLERLRSIGPDVIHFHSPNPLLAFPVYKYIREHRSILVVSHHADLNRPFPVRMVANHAFLKMLLESRRIITYTKNFRDQARELFGLRGKVYVIPHGLKPPEKYECARVSPRASLCVGFLGRLEKWKGIQVLIDAVSRSDAARSIIVAGDGAYRARLQRYRAQHRSNCDVEFRGAVSGSDKEQFFEDIDVLALPSLNSGESYGQCLVEAQLRGIPVLASDLPTGVREICDYGKAGILVEPGNRQAWRDALKKISRPEIYKDLAVAGLAHALENYSEDTSVEKLGNFYGELFAER